MTDKHLRPLIRRVDDVLRAGRDVGVIAEDIETLFPLVVVRDRAGVPAVNYPKLCVYLLRALQELAGKKQPV